ncbi:hypothetical protein PAESOLCIP111_03693 [Paenibacillus solanacearum]|uniref:Uncharacterized protein n=1 Tax=Paenibacillus solanacearum TaxID=2048548 RepID=A0A916NK06_9BACL|nr:hypothetical protein [Paenibacillus solanacearum]CAG7635691.1 hypothetical protein PAESOLCIP111_03693 [Paenibacillus solanacearum]
MTSSRNHQGAHGIGQAEEQLNQQAEAAEAIQGTNETDQAVLAAANRNESELDEIIERQSD